MKTCIGRKREISLLNQLLNSNKTEFIAIYGRRRVGKTYLVHEFFKDKGIFLEITGSKKATKSVQLNNFFREFLTIFPDFADKSVPQNWDDAFYYLKEAIKNIPVSQKIILFLDELPWLASPRSGFLPALEYVWNRHFSRMQNLKIIVCGSAASWMIKKIVNNKEGLYGRLSATIALQPFTLAEVEEYLKNVGVELTQKQIVDLYMINGGVGKYLSYIERGKSSAQIINQHCFTPNGPLFLEFQNLFDSLFDEAKDHLKIVRELARNRYGISQAALLAKSGLVQSGYSSDILNELEASGFIMSVPAYGKKMRDRQFRLIDEYSYFYLKWIEEIRTQVLYGSNQDIWEQIRNSRGWSAWSGYAFENICLKHIASIKRALGISAVKTREFHWNSKGTAEKEGCEIDLIIDRSDQCINLCEIKYSETEFVITKDYAEMLERKKRLFKEETGTKKTIFITMITPYGCKQNQYAMELVQKDILLKDLFE